jgi:transcriptional regulator with XRE-family HTH domain
MDTMITRAAESLTEVIRTAVLADQRTQKELAEACGLHRTSLSRWLRGRHDLTGRNLDKLAVVLGLHVSPIKDKT